jgi:hypothetical protein
MENFKVIYFCEAVHLLSFMMEIVFLERPEVMVANAAKFDNSVVS